MLDVNNVSPDVLLDPNLVGVVGKCAFDATTLLHDVAVLVADPCC